MSILPLWWRANKALDANKTDARGNKGGRPVARPANWISGILDCPECGGKLFLNAGLTPAKDRRTGKPRVQKPRTPRLRCGGHAKRRLSCGDFKGIDAQPVIDLITGMFAERHDSHSRVPAGSGERPRARRAERWTPQDTGSPFRHRR